MSMNDALEAQKETPKKIFMDVYTDWCGPCKLLDKNTFGDKDVIKFVNENYYPVKFNAEGTEEIMYQDFNYTNPNYQEGRKGRNSQHFLANALKISGRLMLTILIGPSLVKRRCFSFSNSNPRPPLFIPDS